MKFLLIILLSISAFANTTYITTNFVVQNSELYCLNSGNVLVYSVGDILDGNYAKHCSYNKDTIDKRLQKSNEYKNSLEGKLYLYLKYLVLFIGISAFIFAFCMLFGVIAFIFKDKNE